VTGAVSHFMEIPAEPKCEESSLRHWCRQIVRTRYDTGKGCKEWAVVREPRACDEACAPDCAGGHGDYYMLSNWKGGLHGPQKLVAYGTRDCPRRSRCACEKVQPEQFEADLDKLERVASHAFFAVRAKLGAEQMSDDARMALLLLVMMGVEDVDVVVLHDYYAHVQRMIDDHHDVLAVPRLRE